MKALLLSTLILSATAAPIPGNDRIAFVYEVVRHGARAPLANEPPGTFQVPS